MLNHPLSQIIAQLLVTLGQGKWMDDASLVDADWALTFEGFRDEHDLSITTFEVEGKREDKRSHRTGEPTIFPGCSVQVRALDDSTARRKAYQVANLLDTMGCRLVTVEANRYKVTNFSRLYNPVFLMQEDRFDRRVWVFRGNVTIHQEV